MIGSMRARRASALEPLAIGTRPWLRRLRWGCNDLDSKPSSTSLELRVEVGSGGGLNEPEQILSETGWCFPAGALLYYRQSSR